MEETQFRATTDCFLCKRVFQVGPHRYEGRRVPAWDIMICDICRSSNWDGVVPTVHPDLIDHLQARGIDYQLNRKGWLDIPD